MSDNTYSAILMMNPDGSGVQYGNTKPSGGGTTIVQKPTITVGTYTYNGTAQGPEITWQPGMEANAIVTGATQINAGTYTLTIALKNSVTMMWNDLTTANITQTYTIDKATPTISLSKSSVSLDSTTMSDTVTVTKTGDGNVTAISSDTSIATTSVSENTVTITATGTTGSATISIYTESTTNYNQSSTSSVAASCSFVPLKTFAAATDSEIAQMVAAADAGQIDLYEDCGWRVGQERTTTISAIASSGTYDGVSWSVGERQSSQQVTLVLMHQGGYNLVTAVKDKQGQNRQTCSFVVGLKNCLTTQGYMNSSNTNSGSWRATARRNWCNGGFRQAINSTLRPAFKQFQCITGTYSGGTAAGGSNITTQDYFALPAGKEVFGGGSSTNYSTDNESNALAQFTWYQTTSNRFKTLGNTGSADTWWWRSPYYGDSTHFCLVYSSGIASANYASVTYGLAPFGCI